MTNSSIEFSEVEKHLTLITRDIINRASAGMIEYDLHGCDTVIKSVMEAIISSGYNIKILDNKHEYVSLEITWN